MGLAVCFACLTTGIGLTTTCGQYFEEVSKGKISTRKRFLSLWQWNSSSHSSGWIHHQLSCSSVDIYLPDYDCTHSLLCLRPIHPIRLDVSWSSDWCRNRRPRTRNQHPFTTFRRKPTGDTATGLDTFPLATYGLEWIVPTLQAPSSSLSLPPS